MAILPATLTGSSVMKNIDMKVSKDKKTLTIVIDLTKEQGLSKSEKSMVIGTTSGNTKVPEHDDISIGINCYKKA